MKRNVKTTIILSILLVLLPLVQFPVEAFVTDPPLISTTTTDADAIRSTRKMFFHDGRYWLFYSGEDGDDDSDIDFGFRTSTDGETWSALTYVRNDNGGRKFSVFYNGSIFDYIYVPFSDNKILYIRRGTPISDGTVTWATPSQEVAPAPGSDMQYRTGEVAIDSNGYPYVTYRRRNSTTGDTLFFVTKSQFNNGTWSDASNYPLQLQIGTHSTGHIGIVPLTSGKMYVSYHNTTHIWGRIYNGSAWESEETISTMGLNDWEQWSMVAEGDTVHYAFCNTDKHLIHVKRSGGSWGSESTVKDTIFSRYPYLCYGSTNSKIYLFWWVSTSTQAYYVTYDGSSWDATTTTWLDFGDETLTNAYCVNLFQKDFSNRIGIAYMTNDVSPYNIRFSMLRTDTITLTLQARDKDGANLPRQVTFSGTLGNGSSFEESSDSTGNLALTTNGGWTTVNVAWGSHTVAAETTTMIDTSETVTINTYIERLDSDSYYLLASLDNTDISSAGLQLMGHVNWQMPRLSGSGTVELKVDCANWVATSEPFKFRLNDFYHLSGWTWSSSTFTYSIDLSSADSFIVEMWWVSTGRDPTEPSSSVIVSPVDTSEPSDVTVSPHIIPERQSTFTIAPLTLVALALGCGGAIGIVAYTFNWFRTRDTVESLFNGKGVTVDWGIKRKSEKLDYGKAPRKKKREKWK